MARQPRSVVLEGLVELRTSKGWRQEDLAAAAGIDQTTVSRAESASVSMRTARRLALALDAVLVEDGSHVPAQPTGRIIPWRQADPAVDELARHGAVRMSLAEVSERSAAGVGMGSGVGEVATTGEVEEVVRVPLVGGCMEPAIPSGAWVIVKPGLDTWRVGQVVIASTSSGLVCKRVVRHEGHAMLRGDDGSIVDADDQTRVLGVDRGLYTPIE